MKCAVLIHCLDWRSGVTEFNLEGGISLCRTEGSDVERLYQRLCEIDNVDQGDPYNFRSHVMISDAALNESFPDWGGPFSVISRCCNIIAFCTSSPLGMCRLVSTKDDFCTSWIPSTVIYEQNPHEEVLLAYPDFLTGSPNGTITLTNAHFPALDDVTMQEIAACWSTQLRLMSTRDFDNHRIDNALSYFFYSWRSYYLDHVCLNLAIVLESLFSPFSNQEISHQIAFNVSRFCEKDSGQRESVYKMVKRFYALRSQIVHGGKARDRDLYALTPQMFHFCARLLKSIMRNYPIARQFCNEQERKALFSKWMFGE
jgi:hypothetical protein